MARPKKSKQPRKPRPAPNPNQLSFSIADFCILNRISNGGYYNLRKLGLGPVEMKVGGRILISAESAAAWRRAREEATTAAQAA